MVNNSDLCEFIDSAIADLDSRLSEGMSRSEAYYLASNDFLKAYSMLMQFIVDSYEDYLVYDKISITNFRPLPAILFSNVDIFLRLHKELCRHGSLEHSSIKKIHKIVFHESDNSKNPFIDYFFGFESLQLSLVRNALAHPNERGVLNKFKNSFPSYNSAFEYLFNYGIDSIKFEELMTEIKNLSFLIVN